MMDRREYHYFISGLPALSFEDSKEWISMDAFREVLENHLHPDDFSQVKYVFLKDDHRNLVEFLETGAVEERGTGNFTVEEFRNQVSLFTAILPSEDILPQYMVQVLKEHMTEEGELDREKVRPVQVSHTLSEGYYRYIMEHGSPFLKGFTEFDFNLQNLLAFIKAGDYSLDQKQFITGASLHAGHLRHYAGKSLVRDHEFEFFEEIVSASESRTFLDEEIKVDKLRWRVIEEMTFFDYFNIDRVLAYLEQMLIIRRWASLKKESGEEKLRKIMNESWQETLNLKDMEEEIL
ncbi:MAG: DUF2764 family protein [Bacteroidales bacterium]|nr:DUF2764 family protein [Bacteroidales bacterium]